MHHRINVSDPRVMVDCPNSLNTRNGRANELIFKRYSLLGTTGMHEADLACGPG